MADHAKQSIEHITKSGEFVCRPGRRVFMEHEIYSPDGKVARKATRQDILDIAENCNESAISGNPARLTFGHTLEDRYDKDGKLIQRFTEEEQPAVRGFWVNYSTEEIKDGKDKGKLALYADQWIQREWPDEKGNIVKGPSYAATFPVRSPEYLRRKKLIDSVALLRRTPALDLGIDIMPYRELHPERVFYSASGAIAGVEDSKGRVRYAYGEDDMDNPPNSPAAPADDRQPAGTGEGDGWTPEHQHFAEEACSRSMGMHHSHAKALLNHAHSMYAAQLGLAPDKMTPHAPAAPAAPGAPGAAPAATATPAAPAAPAPHPPSTPGAPMPEHQRMQAEQDQLERQRYSQRLATLEAELAEHRQKSAVAEEKAMYATFEGQVKQLYMEGRDSINVAKEVEKCKTRKYSQQQLDWHVEELRRIPPGDSLITGGMIPVQDHPMPERFSESATHYSGDQRRDVGAPIDPATAKRDYERSLEVQRYARSSGKSMEEAEKWWAEIHLNGSAR